MDKVGDLVAWILGGLLALVFLFVRQDRKGQTDKFTHLFNKQREAAERLGVVETKVDGFEAHILRTVDEIKVQNTTMGKDLVEIKIALASFPKRTED